MTDNRQIYDEHYSPSQLDVSTAHRPYDQRIIEIRRSLLREWAHGDVLDLCCGSGSYFPDVGDNRRRLVGVDFSRTMLHGLRERPGEATDATGAVCGDARALPFASSSFDTVFSFTALYYVPDLAQAAREVRRVLRPGGVALLELGNLSSLNTLVSRAQHDAEGWAIPYHVPYRDLIAVAASIGEVLQWRSLQLLPMYGTPRRLWPLYPLLHQGWKRPMSWQPRKRMLDEFLASLPLLRRVAFRHLVVIRRR